MIHTTAIDVVLVNSGLLPAHVAHPCFGIHLVSTVVLNIFSAVSGQPPLTLQNLNAALNPLLPVAELADQLRFLSVVLSVIITTCLWLAVVLMKRPTSLLFCVLCLVAIGTERCFAYHSILIRSDLYAALFWSLSVLAVVSAAIAKNKKNRTLFLVLSGAMIGISMLTKVQYVVLLATVPVLYLFVRFFREYREHVINETILSLSSNIWISTFNFVVFICFSVAAYNSPIDGDGHFRESFGVTGFWAVVLLILTGLFISSFLFVRSQFLKGISRVVFEIAQLMLCGFILAFFSHFAVFSEVGKAWSYLLWDFKIIFFGKLLPQLEPEKFRTSSQFLVNAKFILFPIVAHLVALTLLSFQCFRNLRYKNQYGLIAMFLLSGLAFANLFFAVRDVRHQDILLAEPIFNFLTFVYLSFFVGQTYDSGKNTTARISSIVSFAVVVLILVSNSVHFQSRFGVTFPFKESKHLNHVYNSEQKQFSAIMFKSFYEPGQAFTTLYPHVMAALTQAEHHSEVKKVVSQTLPNQVVSLSRVGLIERDLKIPIGSGNFSINEFSSSLQGATLVDLSGVLYDISVSYLDRFYRRIAPAVGILPADVSRFTELDSLAVDVRPDTLVYLLLEAEEMNALVGAELPKESAQHLVLRKVDSGEAKIFSGIPLINFHENPLFKQRMIEWGNIKGPFYLAIQKQPY